MVASKKELALTLEQVNEVLELRLPEGVFYWKVSKGSRAQAGSKAGTLSHGYIQIMINGNMFMAHRLIWFVTYGKFPDNHIDHVDGNRSNNRIGNLRDVTNKINHQNKPKYSRFDADLPNGVCAKRNKYDEIVGYYAYWQGINGKQCRVWFGLKKWHTQEAANAAATIKRNFEFDKLNQLGADYTNRHGQGALQ